ncbi:MAG: S46 family peptidase [Phycisphaerae bacterium]
MWRLDRQVCRAAAAAAVLAGSSWARADEGMWLLNRPPAKLLKERHQFEVTPAWLEHVQKSCVRIGAGGSGSIVSADGLVMTNHHVGSDAIEKLSTEANNYIRDGFLAATRADELKCKDEEFEVLQSIEDVTERVNAAVTAGMSDADANTARRKAMTTIEQESKEKTGLISQVVTLYQGARFHLYRYQRYTDIRLVMAPEEQIAFFGGDTDNFEYPRFNLDVSFFRIYENGQPLKCEHYLRWSRGSKEGDLAFVLGHPGRTQRLYTVDHLRFLRDVETPSILRKLWRREVTLQSFAGRSAENARIANGDRRSVENSRKAFTGILAGLLDPELMAGKIEAERKLRGAVDGNPEWKKKWGDAWDKLAASRRSYATFYERHAALEGRRSVLRSDLLTIGRTLVRMAEEKSKPNADRLREFTDNELPSREQELFSAAPIYDGLEIDRIAAGLSFLAETFGGEDALVRDLLAGQSPRARAAAMVSGTQLKDVEFRRKLATGGTAAIAGSNDPVIAFVRMVDPQARALRKRFEDEIESVERDAYAKIAAAQFAINGEDMYPDATFTLRLAFGPVSGYVSESARVPAFTDFLGMYARQSERGGVYPFNLPKRWMDRRSKLNLNIPFNFVCTADIIGGNSGSPVVNRAGEVIGLIFDGNIEGLVWDIAYTDRAGRAVAVDSRGLVEALRKVYDAEKLAEELLGKP